MSDQIVLTTRNIEASSTTKPDRVLVAENKEGNYQLYKEKNNVILVHEDIEKSFENWYWSVGEKTPEMYYADFDDDGEKELLIVMVISRAGYTNANNEGYYNAMVMVEPIVDEKGNKDFSVITAGAETWKRPFTEAIKCELSQLKSNDKFLQFVMDDCDETFAYDDKTGISTNKYVYYAKAIRLADGSYAKFSRWVRGSNKYYVGENNELLLDLQLLAYYEGVKAAQYIGDIHMNIAFKDGKFIIVPNTISFVPNPEFLVSDPRKKADGKWKSIINNSAGASAVTEENNEIKWIETEFNLNSFDNEVTVSFAGRDSQIKCVDKVEITQNAIVMTAKGGYVFSDRPVGKAEYSVIINDAAGNPIDIVYNCEVINTENVSKLKFKFDKTYNKEELNKIVIKFGA